MTLPRLLLAVSLFVPVWAHAAKIAVAAAADLKFAMDEIVAMFRKTSPGDTVDVVYGSSGRFHAQIRQGAPYDLYFSADIGFPRDLAQKGLAASQVKRYAVGRIVLWSATMDATRMSLADLARPAITRVAIANPRHAPYGQRAQEALRAAGIWNEVERKLVYGDNIAHTAQFVETGNAQVGIIALSLALNPRLASKGGYRLIPQELHSPLEQGYVVTRRAADNPLATRFAAYVEGRPAREVLTKFGFVLPGGAGS